MGDTMKRLQHPKSLVISLDLFDAFQEKGVRAERPLPAPPSQPQFAFLSTCATPPFQIRHPKSSRTDSTVALAFHVSMSMLSTHFLRSASTCIIKRPATLAWCSALCTNGERGWNRSCLTSAWTSSKSVLRFCSHSYFALYPCLKSRKVPWAK